MEPYLASLILVDAVVHLRFELSYLTQVIYSADFHIILIFRKIPVVIYSLERHFFAIMVSLSNIFPTCLFLFIDFLEINAQCHISECQLIAIGILHNVIQKHNCSIR